MTQRNNKDHDIKIKHSIKKTVFLMLASLTVLMFSFYTCLSIAIAFSVEDEVINQLLFIEGNYLQVEYNKSISADLVNTTKIIPRFDYIRVYTDLADMPLAFSETITQSGSGNEIFTASKDHFHYREIKLSNSDTLYVTIQ